MAKSLYGGGAVLTGALLLASLVFNAHPSVAENLAATDPALQTQSKLHPAGMSLPGDASANLLAEVANEAAPRAEVFTAASPKLKTSPTSIDKNSPKSLFPNAAAEKFTATAYSLYGRTASGATVRRGFIAADRHVLPLGTRVRVEAGNYTGEYLVADRGSAIRGHIVDIWVPSTREAMRFGRRPIKLTVLSYGARPAARASRAKR